MARRGSAIVLVFVVAATSALATTIHKFSLRQLWVAGDRVAFFATGLVVLDARSGAVIVRERRVRDGTIIETPHGLLVGTAPLRRGRPARFRLFSARGDPAWEVDCDLWHAGQNDLICVDPRSSPRDLQIHVRSLTDGRIRWSFATGGAGGEALDARGRLMFVNQEMVYDARAEAHVPHNTRLAVLDLADGRLLASLDLPKLKAASWEGAVTFDGERVVMRLRDVDGCARTTLHTYTLDLPRRQFLSSADCFVIDVDYAGPSNGFMTHAELEVNSRRRSLEDGSLVWSWVEAGMLLERRHSRATWQMLQPFDRAERSWLLENVHERSGLLLLEHNDWRFGTLDAIDQTTGRPLWRYVFPAVTVLGSMNRFFPPPRGIGQVSEQGWQAVLRHPPPPLIGLIRPLTSDEQLVAGESLVTSLPRHPAPPTIFDPAATQPWPEFLVAVGGSWLPVAAGIGVFIVARRERVAPRASLRRVLIGLGLLGFLLMARQVTGRWLGAEIAAQLLIAAAYIHVVTAALRVKSRRLTWLLRGSLALLLLPVGFITLLLV